MLTVTYGQTASSYLAIRCLHQCAFDFAKDFPLASKTILSDFYVDDLLTGANSVSEAINIGKDVKYLLEKGCFKLRKWFSNDPDVLAELDSEAASRLIRMGPGEHSKTLGLCWESHSDTLFYLISESKFKKITKRTILSDISQIFDPLGLLSPCIITANVILQKLWLERIGWDESLPLYLHSQWVSYRGDLENLSDMKIARHVFCQDVKEVQIHGFSDASELAYGAAVYIRTVTSEGKIFANLLCAKSKVAPLKTVTIPRLELCGALILAKLVDKVKRSLDMPNARCIFWTDSTIVLGWLKMSPHLLQTFVANRVSQIQNHSCINDWRHVMSRDNPADYISRGIKPSLIATTDIWWYGPKWLQNSEKYWPKCNLGSDVLPELRKVTITTNVAEVMECFPFKRYSSLGNLERVIAYCRRFVKNCLNRNSRQSGILTAKEIDAARLILIRLSQKDSFFDDIKTLKEKGCVSAKSRKILGLSPFLDESGILRVGGRLANSDFSYKKRHPAILSGAHDFPKLLLKREHVRSLHAGPQHLLSSVREEFWRLGGKNLARKTVHDCIRCFKVKPESVYPLMGNLPSQRVAPATPSFRTGVDYAGPIRVRESKIRRARKFNCYIAIFICFCTKAIHLEIVMDLTSESFIAALRRFCARRGKPSEIFSDNGTNFIGAESELERFLKKGKFDVTEFAENYGVNWHFIPPSSPHFGGLWEAGVKATKFHLRRVIGDASITVEQLSTLLCQIEAILNSRPMYPLSSDPNDLSALSPAHFLIGRPLTSLADPNLLKIPENRLSHWQQLQQLNQHFWARWSKEYNSELQQRNKWKGQKSSIQVGDLVLVKEDNLPPLKWRLGRVTQLFPGKDNIVRVVSLKTATGEFKRNATKLCVLPIANSEKRNYI